METFRVSFAVSYIIMLSGIIVIFYINPYWQQAWFYLVEEFTISCYYFFIDNFLKIIQIEKYLTLDLDNFTP